MSRDTAGRGRCVLRLSDLDVGDLIAPGTAVVLKTDNGSGPRYAVATVYIRTTGNGAAVIYGLAHTVSDFLTRLPRVREFEADAALVELADPPPPGAADELTATTPGGSIKWVKDKYGDSINGGINGAAHRFRLIRDSDMPTPVYMAVDDAARVVRYSDRGILPDVKAWCEARLSEALPLIADPIPAPAAALSGEPQPVPAAAGSDF